MLVNDQLIVPFGLKDSSRMINKNDEGSITARHKKISTEPPETCSHDIHIVTNYTIINYRFEYRVCNIFNKLF